MRVIMDWNIFLFLLWLIISAVNQEEPFRYLRQSRISRFRFIKSRVWGSKDRMCANASKTDRRTQIWFV